MEIRKHVGQLSAYLHEQVSIAPLASLRVLFGFAMLVSCIRFLALGWVHEQYVEPKVHFTYLGFEWVVVPGELGMYLVFGVMSLAAIGVMIGAWYRIASVVFFILFTYVELLDKTYYLNHYYFVSIAAMLFAVLPAHRWWSVDARRTPSIALTTVPRWMIGAFKLQLGIVYFYAGIAKITPHWLIDAMPLRIWLPANDSVPLIGWLFAISWIPWVFAWAGLVYDCTVPFFLLWKRTRIWAYLAVVGFHTTTGVLFQIGVFPVVMILATLVFFSAGAHQKALEAVLPFLRTASSTNTPWTSRLAPLLRTLLVVHFAIQVLVPFRYVLYPGNLYWTEEGYRFSWRVMLVEKAGTATFTVYDPDTGRPGFVNNRDWLNSHQEKQMSFQPDMILQFAHILRDHYTTPDGRVPRVTADVWVTMNGEASRRLVDQECNLAAEHVGFHRYTWVLPWND